MVLSRRDYCGAFLYADGVLERILTYNGWYSPGGTYTAVINDHQGNLRATASWKFSSSSSGGGSGSGTGVIEFGVPAGDTGSPASAPGALTAYAGTVNGNGAGTASPQGIGTIGGPIGGGIVVPVDPNRNRRYSNLTAYSPYGLPLADWQGDDERYLYSGKELDRDGGLWLYDFHARQYDPQLGRFTTPDPLQEKYLPLSPYLYCAANPISLVDPSGMKFDFSQLQLYDKVNSENTTNKIISDLCDQTGLNLYLDESNFLCYETDDSGAPIINKDDKNEATGSESERNYLIKRIDQEDDIVQVARSAKCAFDRIQNTIGIGTEQIEAFINGSVNVNDKSMGYGMSFMHEALHSDKDSSYTDSKQDFKTGNTVDKMNQFRDELNKKGFNYGERFSYPSIPISKTKAVIPMDNRSYNNLIHGSGLGKQDSYIIHDIKFK